MKCHRILVFAGVAAFAGMVGCSDNKTPVASAAPPMTNTSAPSSTDPDQDLVITGPIVVENQIDLAAQRDGVVAKIIADTGTPIFAAAGGMVTVAEYHHQYGNVVEIDHSRSIVTVYGHLSRFAKGTRVALDSVIYQFQPWPLA